MPETENHYKLEEFLELRDKAPAIFAALCAALSIQDITPGDVDDSVLDTAFGILVPCEGCVPPGYYEEIDQSIIKKFDIIYVTALDRAENLIKAKFPNAPKSLNTINATVVTEPSVEDSTHVAIVDYQLPICYHHSYDKAWHFNFATLAAIGERIEDTAQDIVKIFERLVLNGGLE